MNTDYLKQLDRARQHMDACKREFTASCEDAQKQVPGAGQRCTEALAELNKCRRELNRLLDAQPASPWTEMARVRDEKDNNE
jgi:hypothetical protein